LKTTYRFLLLTIVCTALAAQSPQAVRSFSILHTNDLHAHLLPDDDGMGGFAALATELRHQREGCTACLYLNAGDLVQGTPVSTIFHGLPVYEVANMLGIDVSTLGNHEFDYGWAEIPSFLKIAHFPVVSANVVNAKGDLLAGRGYVIKTVGGLRIAVIGVVLGDLSGNLATEEAVGPWHVVPVPEAVKKTVLELRGRADMIIVLGHIHDEETDQILHDVPEVSIVVAGHDHKGYKELREFQHRYAVEEKSYGVELGRLDFQFDTVKHEVINAKWRQIPIDSHKIAAAPDVQAAVDKWEAKVAKIVDVPIGEAARRIQGPDLRHLIELAMAETTGADIGYINTGNVRGFLPQGRLLARHVWNVLPFDNYILAGTFKGSELPANITKEFVAQGKTAEPDRMYKVATTDFTVANQAAPSQLGTTGMKFPEKGPLQRDAMLKWIQAKKVIE
jgi:5'-nucleotidase/UDP-sugar diphosphatase